jgi:hypothetical protein
VRRRPGHADHVERFRIETAPPRLAARNERFDRDPQRDRDPLPGQCRRPTSIVASTPMVMVETTPVMERSP